MESIRQPHRCSPGNQQPIYHHQQQAIAHALAQLCEGHWHDFATLRDPIRFERRYDVAGGRAHLLALTLQVRLIDLFHITEDRTPYALWRFVSPSDKKSKEEWAKHQALHSVNVDPFEPGRAIRVQGYTDDEEVWADLQDLHRYCVGQIEGTGDLSARERLSKPYGLDFIKLEWAVATGSLQPIDLRFEFDRSAMLRILSEDIYDGDHRVFLRELLQNSIDALKTRRAKHRQIRASSGKKRQRNVAPEEELEEPTIYFTAEHQADGSARITCRDYGVGMDEYVLKKYFAVAGVSHYRSDDFVRQNLGFEPISRFGVGILSCFMIADSLEVRTYRDPECGPPLSAIDMALPGANAHRARRLAVRIPNVGRQFVVREGEPDFDVGTEIILSVKSYSPEHLARRGNAEYHADFRKVKVTEYLCETAGFVEFPIHVRETWPDQQSPSVTLILHPDRDAETEKTKYDVITNVSQLSRQYPWDDVFLPGSTLDAKQVLNVLKFELNDLLPSQGYEGWIDYLSPKCPETWDYVGGEDTFQFVNFADKTPIGRRVYSNSRPSEVLVYREGIRIWQVNSPITASYSNFLPTPRLVVNLPTNEDLRPNIARSSFHHSRTSWAQPIFDKINTHIQKTVLPELLRLPLHVRLLRLAWLSYVFHEEVDVVARFIPSPEQPVLLLKEDGLIDIKLGFPCVGQSVFVASGDGSGTILDEEQWRNLMASGSNHPTMWRGPAVILDHSVSSHVEGMWRPMHLIATRWITSQTTVQRVSFVTAPPSSGSSISLIISQVVDHPQIRVPSRFNFQEAEDQRQRDLGELQKIVDFDFDEVKAWKLLSRYIPSKYRNSRFTISALPFDEPYKDKYALESWGVNLCHPFTQGVVKCLAMTLLAANKNDLDLDQVFDLKNILNSITGYPTSYKQGTILVEFGDALFGYMKKNNLAPSFMPPAKPSKEEYIPEPDPVYTIENGLLSLVKTGPEFFGLPLPAS